MIEQTYYGVRPITMASHNKTRKLKIVKSLKEPEMVVQTDKVGLQKKIYNEDFIKILEELENIMSRQGETFRARAYHKASETIMTIVDDITDASQLNGKPNIGETILSKLQEYVDTGVVSAIELKKHDPLNIITKVYGIGPKNAQALINDGIDTIEKIRAHPERLTAAQKIGAEFFYDIEQKIPREEIDTYKKMFDDVFAKSTTHGAKFEIVGSYRRGKIESGDIDIIITHKQNNKDTFVVFLDALIKEKIITHILSRGQTKSLTLAKISGKPSRRVDFMYAPPDEYAFAILYFTGSKAFNTMQRQRAIDLGYTLNEHGMHEMCDGNKGPKVPGNFQTEEDIFRFLCMEYKDPRERTDGRAIISTCPKKDNIELFNKDGIAFLKTLTEKEISDIVYKANQSYYGNETPIMSDTHYDMLTEYILEEYPNNSSSKTGHTTLDVGYSIKHKVKLPYEMWSMDKIKPDTNTLVRWISKHDGPYVFTCKLDGVSCMYASPDKLYTRGNGKIGQDISHMIPYLRLPKDEGIVIRGELIISKELFASNYSGDFSNSRNFVAGVVNQKTPSAEKIKDICFVAYEIICPEMKPSDQFKKLETMDIEIVHYDVDNKLTIDILSSILVMWRETYKYEIDGVICCNDNIYCRSNGNPEHAFAFKMNMPEQVFEANVLAVIWSASKDGYLKPRVQIEPTVLCGVTIEYATGFNAKFIVDNKIGTGAVVSIIRAGDVIPHILKVIKHATEPMMPSSTYTWTDSNVDIVLVDKLTDNEVNQKVITLFFKTIGVDGLGPGNVKKIIDSGHDSIISIISMTRDQFLKVDGFKQKMSDKIYEGILQKLSEASLPALMDATNIFGRGFGEKKFSMILAAIPDIIVSSKTDIIKIKQVGEINGMAIKTSERFVEKLSEFRTWIKDAGLEYKLLGTSVANTNIDKEHPLYGKKIVMTGFRDKDLIQAFERLGAISADSVSKTTFVLLVKDTSEDTGKADQARKIGIPLMTPTVFRSKFNI